MVNTTKPTVPQRRPLPPLPAVVRAQPVVLAKTTPHTVEVEPPQAKLTGRSESHTPVVKAPVSTGGSAFGLRLRELGSARAVGSSPSSGEIRLTTTELHAQLRDPTSELAQRIHGLTHGAPKFGATGAQISLRVTDMPTKTGGTTELPITLSYAGLNVDIKATLPNASFGTVSGAARETNCLHLSSQKRGKHVHLEWVGAHPGDKIAVGGDQLFKTVESLYSAVRPEVLSLADAAGFPLVRGDAPSSFPVQACVVGPYTKGASLYVQQGYLPADSGSKNLETFRAANALAHSYTMVEAVRDLGGQAASGRSGTGANLNTLLSGFADKGLTPNKDETVGAFYTRLAAATPATLSRESVHDFYRIAMARDVAEDGNAAMRSAIGELTTRTMLSKPYEAQ